MRAVVQHGWNWTIHLAESVLAHNSYGNTCGSEVLLCAGIYGVVFTEIDTARENIRTHIGDQRTRSVGILTDLGTINRVVACVVEIIHTFGNCIALGNESIVGILRRSYHIHLAEQARLLDGIGSPCTRVEESGFGLKEVIWNHAELHRGATSEPQNFKTGRYIENFFHQSCGLVYNGLELLAAVRNLEKRETHVRKIKNGVGRILNGVFAQNRRSGIKIMFLHYQKIWLL